jgi:hypothetical protein
MKDVSARGRKAFVRSIEFSVLVFGSENLGFKAPPYGPGSSLLNRLLKNAHLRRSPHPSSLQRTFRYASLLRISGALRLGIFDQPEKNESFNRLLILNF